MKASEGDPTRLGASDLAQPGADTGSRTSVQAGENRPADELNGHDGAALTDRHATPLLHFAGDPADYRLWGLTTQERLRRQFARCDIREARDATSAPADRPLVVLRADAVIDQPLIPILAERRGLVLCEDDDAGASPVAVTAPARDLHLALDILARRGSAAPGMEERSPDALDAAFWRGLRKRETPYALIARPHRREAIEWRMFMGTYKGATDLVTKYLWPRPAFHVTRLLARLGVTPNTVTAVSAAAMLLACWLFLQGGFLPGLVAAWFMTFLDTVDGKLARTTVTSSRWGDVFDHGIDLVHPPFWYVAWGYGVVAAGFGWSPFELWSVLAVILAGYVIQRAMEGIAIKLLGMEIHIWRPRDTLFRQVTARRNPNLVLLTLATLVGRPDIGLIAVAVWTALCLILHVIQLAQALAAKRRNGPLVSWMSIAADRE